MTRVAYVDNPPYPAVMYRALAGRALDVRAVPTGLEAGTDATRLVGDAEIVHVSYPEHIIVYREGEREYDNTLDGWDARLRASLQFLQALTQAHVKIVWSLTNRRPHVWWSPHGDELYRAWARAADAVIHLSEWGMKLMRQELPFRADAVHAVIPLGYFEDLSPARASRRELELALGLPECGLRIGLTGRPHKARGIPLILEAFARCSRPDLQLLVTAIKPEDLRPDDPRIVVAPFTRWRTREEISDYLNVCDALALAVSGPTYLSSATHSDALGVGIPMIVNRWPYFVERLGEAALYYDDTPESLTAFLDRLTGDAVAAARQASLRLRSSHTWATAAMRLASLLDRL